MDFIDRSLEEAPFSSKHILNFLHNGPPEDREDGVPDFDWRDIFNLADRVIRMLNQYGEVSGVQLNNKKFSLVGMCFKVWNYIFLRPYFNDDSLTENPKNRVL